MQPPWRKSFSLRYSSIVIAILVVGTEAFIACPDLWRSARRGHYLPVESNRGQATRLCGIKEWKAGQPGGEPRQLGFLPFPAGDVMCPGETKALHLYEARFLELFENAIKNHGGCVGGALFIDDGVLVRVGQLCDIVAWERESIGVSLAVRCVGRILISDIQELEPYIKATVVELVDSVGEGKKERNEVISSEVFSLHRQCVALEEKMASAPRDAGHIDNGAVLGEINEREGVYFRVDGEEEANSIGGVSNDLTSVEDDLKSKFIRGGGELDLDVSGVASTTGGEGKLQRADTGEGQGVRKGVDIFTAVDDEDEEDEDDDDDDDDEDDEQAPLEDLLWGHEEWVPDGFETNLEEQVDEMYANLKADVLVTLEEDGKRGGPEATVFGASGSGNGVAWGGVNTLAGIFAENPGGVFSESEAKGDELPNGGERNEGKFLWGCSSKEEERNQLVSYASLGCFDPTARLKSLMIKSTGRRLRMARQALVERLKVLVAKNALNQLGGDQTF